MQTSSVLVEDVDRSTARISADFDDKRERADYSALDQIMASVDQAITNEQYARGIALAERAVRMQPNDGRPYLALAKINYLQSQLSQAREFLGRASALATQDSQLQRDIEKFVSRHQELGGPI